MTAPLDVAAIRRDFPILDRVLPNGAPLIYLDSANSSQKPRQVIDAMADHMSRHYANVARAVHTLGTESTEAFEGARDKVAAFINAPERAEVIFTKNATEAINLVARTIALTPGDDVVISEMEHHSNIVPWQLATERAGAGLKWFGITDAGRLDLSNLDEVITERTKIVSYVYASNILGTVNPTEAIVKRAREVGALVMLDASQAAPHMPIDVQELGVDFVAFTGHKMLGPTGIGVLWGRRDVLEGLPPFLGGGDMIETVRMERSTYAELPHKFEAGTPPIVEAVGLGAAIDYLNALGMDNVKAYEKQVAGYAIEQLAGLDGVRIIGPETPIARTATISFVVDGIHPHDVGQLLDEQGIAVRVGHHCAAPTCRRFGVPATTRASFYVYNTPDEVDKLVEGIRQVQKVFS